MPSFQLTPERLIANFKNNSTQSNARKLLDGLQSAALIVPVASIPEPGQSDDTIQVLVLDTKSEAGKVLPVFTNNDEAEKFAAGKSLACARIPFTSLLNILENSQTIDNVIFNPEGNAIAFGRVPLLHSMNRKATQASVEVFDKDTTMIFRDGRSVIKPEHLDRLVRLAGTWKDIESLWLAIRFENGLPSSWMLVVSTPAPRSDGHALLAKNFMEGFEKSFPAAIVYSDDPIAKDIVARFEPIYTK